MHIATSYPDCGNLEENARNSICIAFLPTRNYLSFSKVITERAAQGLRNNQVMSLSSELGVVCEWPAFISGFAFRSITPEKSQASSPSLPDYSTIRV